MGVRTIEWKYQLVPFVASQRPRFCVSDGPSLASEIQECVGVVDSDDAVFK